MADWSPEKYLAFADERTRPARDLLAQVPLVAPQLIYDLGCGPGNSTELLAARYPRARLVGIDSSPAMLAAARRAMPQAEFVEADLSDWQPEQGADLLFSNATFQWLPNHMEIVQALLRGLKPGATLAVQMPDNLDEPSHRLMRETASDGPWAKKLREAAEARAALPSPQAYYEALKPWSMRLDIWHTIYNHPLDGAAAIVEWLKSTGLRPFLDPLDENERRAFLEAYTGRLTRAYPPAFDGKCLLRFPRLFLLAVR